MKHLEGQKVAVIGLGASGAAAARLALIKGGDVYVSDTSSDEATSARGAALTTAGASVELGRHDLDRLAGAGIIVASPGIPPGAQVLRKLRERGQSWISEPELAFRFFDGPLIAVTGTNGKTTTTLLLGHLLSKAGIRVAVGGNVGGGLAPTASDLALMGNPPDWYVLEMSSFQLGGVESFQPEIGVVTNLSPDHMDYYGDFGAYMTDKAQLFKNASENSKWVLPAGDQGVRHLANDAAGDYYFFGGDAVMGGDALVDHDAIALRVSGELRTLLPIAEYSLVGLHNVDNALAASLAAHLAGATFRQISDGLRTAMPLPHRMEPVADKQGILWVNDSKATNVAATVKALESLDQRAVLLLGGTDKGESFVPLAEALKERVGCSIAYGEAGPRIQSEIGDAASVELLGDDFKAVVARATELARPGDVILLSPACSSFDMFESYEDRGRSFAQLSKESE
tara:strand:- start:124224 stop:125591 length:1368 start_codon:yes stop_codon:yes gene_type:complete